MSLTLYRFPFQAMGSPCEIQLYCLSKSQASKIAKSVIQDVQRIEARYSRFKDDSVLSKINRVAKKGGGIAIDEETAALLNYADTCYQQSNGNFDITSGLLRQAWDFKSQKIPSKSLIKKLIKRIGWDKVHFTHAQISFGMPGMELDFGGIGKEYAVDRAAVICQQQGVEHGLVDLGGDINIFGPHADGRPWQVGIQHPRKPGSLLTNIEIYSGAVASSGDYERCIIINGRRYGHVLNPKTGWPVDGFSGITVIADQCVVAGSACTIAMLVEKRGKKWIKDLGLFHIWVDQKGKVGGKLPAHKKL